GGVTKCWGKNDAGQLGSGTNAAYSLPVSVVGLSTGINAIVAGRDQSCALTSGGGVKCWGNNSTGKLGDGSYTNRFVPTNVLGLSCGVLKISAASSTCAIIAGGGAK